QESLLDHVLGVRLGARDAIRHAEDSTTVPLDERAESLTISGFRLGKDESVAVHGLRRLDGGTAGALGTPAGRGMVHGSMGPWVVHGWCRPFAYGPTDLWTYGPMDLKSPDGFEH